MENSTESIKGDNMKTKEHQREGEAHKKKK